MKTAFVALKLFVTLTVIAGLLYPLVIGGIAHLVFPRQANGSLIEIDGKKVGSELIAQRFTDPTYFWPRPSAVDYNPLPSGGSNLGPISADLQKQVADRRSQLPQANGLNQDAAIPPDLLFASGSGLDPDISPAAAQFQVDRVARARELDAAHKTALIHLVDSFVQPRTLGILGEPRVNVLLLNIAVDSLMSVKSP